MPYSFSEIANSEIISTPETLSLGYQPLWSYDGKYNNYITSTAFKSSLKANPSKLPFGRSGEAWMMGHINISSSYPYSFPNFVWSRCNEFSSYILFTHSSVRSLLSSWPYSLLRSLSHTPICVEFHT